MVRYFQSLCLSGKPNKLKYFNRNIEDIPRWLSFSAAVCVVLLFGIVDYITGQEYAFYIFYVIPVLFVVWYVGKVWAYILVILITITWIIDDVYNRSVLLSDSALIWNTAVQLSFFFVIIFLFSSLKLSLVRERLAEEEKLKKEKDVARKVQEKLFPQSTPEMKTIEYYGVCLPADSVGGDYYDYFRESEQTLFLAIGDVTGHGLPAALMMASLTGFLRSNAHIHGSSPDKLMNETNKMMYGSTPSSDFVTLFLSIYNDVTRRLTYVNAGHNPPLLLRNSGTELICLDKSGIFAGAVDDFKYEKHEILLKEGDLLFLYTDGVTEAFNSSEEQFGEERLLSVLKDGINKSPREICESALISVKTWIGNETQADDITIVALKVK